MKRERTHTYLLKDGKELRIGDTVVFDWGGVCNGVQRTTQGVVYELWNDGKFRVEREGLRNATGYVESLRKVIPA